MLVLIDNTKDSINERFGLQLTSGRSKKLTHLTGMHVIINIQSFSCVNLLRKAKFLLATQGIFRLPSHGTNHDASVEQLTSNTNKKKAKTVFHRSKQPSFGYLFFFQAEDGIRDYYASRGLGDVYKRQNISFFHTVVQTKKFEDKRRH